MEPAESLNALLGADVTQWPVARVRLASLVVSDSPRRAGESLEHIRRLAESEVELPPIVVHRPTMRVIDGMHRLRAAELRGEQEIEVRYFDGDEASSFVLAVRANIMHGLPLSLADRKSAAIRIMTLYPQWSDRMVASVTGLAAKTVAASRGRLSADKQQLDVRVGRDGRSRPVNGSERREMAARFMADNPEASLREVARKAGVSPETARVLRARMSRQGAGPVPGEVSESSGSTRPGTLRAARPPHPGEAGAVGPGGAAAVQALRGDPAFRSSESGRSLLRMLVAFLILEECGKQFLEDAPAHCLSRIAAAAHACARGWQGFAEQADHQSQASLSRAAP